MKQYWNRGPATEETLAGGWLHTGDVGYRDADGFYFVHDRIKDMIVSGGENIYPAEVESAIMGCPGVADVAVIGVPDAKWGESVKALIVPVAGAAPDPAAVIAWARKRIAGVQAAQERRVHRSAAAQPVGQGPPPRTARALLGGQGPCGGIGSGKPRIIAPMAGNGRKGTYAICSPAKAGAQSGVGPTSRC